MGYTAPYQQHNYVGEHATSAAATAFVQSLKWDTVGDGTGTPHPGMTYYNTSLGMLFSWDSVRAKWLSVEIAVLQFGRSGLTSPGAYYRGINGLLLSATKGYPALYNGTVCALGYTRIDLDPAIFEVTSSGTTIASVTSSATSGIDTSLNGDVALGGVIAVRNAVGGNDVNRAQIWVRLRWRG